ncbi:MAG: ribose-phosphate diphosphokinase [Candidatus Odinarchaeota archaeon]|nr:ribose-phosphate diphosphokinase [Candidatus Odinarchaeota archaeon]
MKIVAGSASKRLAGKLGEVLNVPVIEAQYKLFPDGESYFRIPESVEGEDIIIVQTTGPPQDKHILELVFLLDTVKDFGAKKVTLVVPYLAYARQDERYLEGEVLSSKVVAKILNSIGANKLLTVDVHNEAVLSFYNFEAINLFASEVFADYIEKMELKDPFVLCPDQERPEILKPIADRLGTEYDWLEKFRDRITGEVKTKEKKLPVKDRDVLIVDDIISTGWTVVNAINILKKQGARDIYVFATHLVFAEGARERILNAGAKEIIGTDSIERDESKVTLAPLIAKHL